MTKVQSIAICIIKNITLSYLDRSIPKCCELWLVIQIDQQPDFPPRQVPAMSWKKISLVHNTIYYVPEGRRVVLMDVLDVNRIFHCFHLPRFKQLNNE